MPDYLYDYLNEEYIIASLMERDRHNDIFQSEWKAYSILDFYNMYDGCFFE